METQTPAPLPTLTSAAGLTAAEVAEPVAAAAANTTTVRTSRTAMETVRANVFTVFNGLLVTRSSWCC